MLIPTQVSNEVVQILKDRLPDHSDSFGNILIWYEKRFRKQLLSAAKCSTRDDFLSRLDPVLFRTTYEDGEVFIRLHRSALDINNFHLIPEGFVIPRQDFRAGSSDDVRVVVQEVTSPSQFWVSLWDQFHLLDRLMEDLNRHYDEHKDRTIYQVETAQVGEYYAAKHAGEWHRVKVRRALHQDGKADIFYIDYGTDEEVSISELRLLDLKFSILPAQALRAKLHNLAPDGHPHDGWTSQACFQFLQLVRMHQVEVDGVSGGILGDIFHWDGDCLSLRLGDSSGSSIHQELIAQGHARVIGDHDRSSDAGLHQIYTATASPSSPASSKISMNLGNLVAAQNDVLRAAEIRLEREPDSAMLKCVLEGQIRIKYLLKSLSKL